MSRLPRTQFQDAKALRRRPALRLLLFARKARRGPRQSGQSLSAIVRRLNRQRIKTRKGGAWKPATIRAIVLRHKG
ncbi:MAG: recombinase family protein [Deltaproteobacteria bacterium]|nr:recombinase family protein [Deltaproteobacteria bacterium]